MKDASEKIKALRTALVVTLDYIQSGEPVGGSHQRTMVAMENRHRAIVTRIEKALEENKP